MSKTTKAKRVKLTDLLVERGECATPEDAKRWILAGRVHVDGNPSAKPGSLVPSDAIVDVRHDGRYVSRGGLKIERAIHDLAIDVRDRVVLDAGASVGGFTDCLLQYGAARVYAVDVGFGQIRGKLAADPRVVNMERTNISDVRRDRLQPPIDLCVADLSYLSLSRAAPILADLFEKPPLLVLLVKPLFEGVPQNRKADLRAIDRAIRNLRDRLATVELYVNGITDSPILGTSGTVEFLARVTRQRGGNFDAQLTAALTRAAALIGDRY